MSDLPSNAMVVNAILAMFPPRVKSKVLEDDEFLNELGISVGKSIVFRDLNTSFRRDVLFERMRKAISTPNAEVGIEDDSGVSCAIEVTENDGKRQFALKRQGNKVLFSDHSALSESSEVRTEWFLSAADDLGFFGEDKRKWSSRLTELSLSDDEFVSLMVDLENTPANVSSNIASALREGRVDIDLMFPSNIQYYQRLVGRCGEASSVREFVDQDSAPFVADLIAVDGKRGLLTAILSGSISLISVQIAEHESDLARLTEVLLWLSEHGDPLSKVSALEILLSNEQLRREQQHLAEKLILAILSEDAEAEGGDFDLLSKLIIIGYGKLAKEQVMASERPFYRRHAVIAQSNLVLRALKKSNLDRKKVAKWLDDRIQRQHGHHFYLQVLTDLRLEPRWLPDFSRAEQLRAECIGRIKNAVLANAAEIHLESLRRLTIGDGSEIERAAPWPMPMLPGPLEGAIQPSNLAPAALLAEVRNQLSAKALQASSFTVLVNIALLFSMEVELPNLAADALKRVQYAVQNAEDESTVAPLVSGLAVVAAVTRSTELASAIRILVRVIRRRNRFVTDFGDQLQIAMVASAAHLDVENWARSAGDWFKELAFDVESKSDAQMLRASLRTLVKAEPTLSRFCMEADAALSAVSH